MELYEAIEKRRTIRVMKGKASEEQLKRILLAGTKAPSGGNSQPWEFIVIDDPEITEQLAEFKYQLSLGLSFREGESQEEIEARARHQKKSFDQTSVVAVCTPSGQSQGAWLCIENMSLAAVAEGLGSGIVTYWGNEKKRAEKILKLPDDYQLVAVVRIGVPGEEGFPREMNPARPRRPEFSWVHKNTFVQKTV